MRTISDIKWNALVITLHPIEANVYVVRADYTQLASDGEELKSKSTEIELTGTELGKKTVVQLRTDMLAVVKITEGVEKDGS